MNFLNLPKEFRDRKKSKTEIYSIEYSTKVTRGSGSEKGPKEILKASYELEYFDLEENTEPYQKGIYTNKPIIKKQSKDAFKDIKQISEKIEIDKNKFYVFLNSDHFSTLSSIRAIEKTYKDFGVIVLDSHSDLRDESDIENTGYHACISNFISKDHKTLLVGIRSQDFYEKEIFKSNLNLEQIKANDLLNPLKKEFNLNLLKKKLKKLPKNIFISIDVDFFDPSLIKNTNTPEPGGFDWYQSLLILKEIFKHKTIIGFDINEFSPKPNQDSYLESYILSKLVYKLISYKFK